MNEKPNQSLESNHESFFKQLINLVPFWKIQQTDWKVTVIRTSLERLGYKTILAYLSLYIVALGATKSQLGIITSVGMLVMGVLGPFVGGWIDRNGAKKVYILGIVVTFLSYITYAVAPDWKIYAVAMVLYYFGNGLSMQSCATICGYCLKNCDRAKGMMICESLAAGLLGMIGPMIGAWIFTHVSGVTDTALAVANDFRPLFYASAFFTAISFFIVFLKLSNTKMGSGKTTGFALKDGFNILKENINARKWILIGAVGNLPTAMVIPYISVYAAEHKLATPAVLAAMVTCQAVTSTILGYPVGILADKYGRKKVLFVLVPLVWLSLILLMTAPLHNAIFLIISGLLLGFVDIGQPLFGAVQREIVKPGIMGVWLGTTKLTNAVISAIMAVVAGFVYDNLGPVWTFIIFIAIDLFIRMPLFYTIPETLGNEVKDDDEDCCSD
ncbi:MAG: MFS transporter [Oscillospiraceae bacterium]|nr:MFS transporter [Oscillospiraceae bacterium]